MIRAGLALAAALVATASAHRTGPPPGHTGAFGEPDCGACHFDTIRDDDAGNVRIRAPAGYQPGQTYRVTIELRHPELPAGGFQLTARLLDGEDAGQQAGTLEPTDARTRVERDERGVAYGSQTARGVPAEGGGTMTWTLRWTPPAGGGAVAFDVAAQVASDDDSEFGERLYTARHVARQVVEKDGRAAPAR